MAKCRGCGHVLDDHWRFCPACGVSTEPSRPNQPLLGRLLGGLSSRPVLSSILWLVIAACVGFEVYVVARAVEADDGAADHVTAASVAPAPSATVAATLANNAFTLADDALFPAIDGDGQWGYINKTGAFVIRPEFASAGRFVEDRAWVWVRMEPGMGYQMLIDRTGSNLTKDWIAGAEDFSGGLAAAQLDSTGKWGFVDTTGSFVIGPSFSDVYSFSEDLAVARLEQRDAWGYIDKTGAFAIKQQFAGARPFSDGLAAIKMDFDPKYPGYILDTAGPWGFIEKTGQIVIQPQFYWTPVSSSGPSRGPEFHDGLAAVQLERDAPWGFIDKTGEFVIQPRFYDVADFSEGVAAVQLAAGDLWGYIDTAGEYVVEPRFVQAGSVSEGLAAVQTELSGPWGYIDRTGEFVLQPGLALARVFFQGVADVNLLQTGGPAYIDHTGTVIWSAK